MNVLKLIILFLFLASCNVSKTTKEPSLNNAQDHLVIAFGSCNKQNTENKLWKEVLKHNPKVWIWGGDNVYSDTDNMQKLQKDYATQLNQDDYKAILKSTKILGTWDDHDYGLNDGGEEFAMRNESQQLFLDFMGVASESPRRERSGVYHSEVIKTQTGSVKIIVLDTRFFRTQLTKSSVKGRRYESNPFGEGTMLGKAQ